MQNVRIDTRNRVTTITLARPEKRNALNVALIKDLSEAFKMAIDDNGTKVIILKGEGEVFCAGADLAYLEQLKDNSFEENLEDSSRLKELYLRIYNSEKFIIAQVEGHAIAGGCGLLTVCDLVVAVPEAKFGYTEVKIGFTPAIVAPFLCQKIGNARGRELLLTGDLINCMSAQSYGLVNRIVEAGSISDEVNTIAGAIVAQNSGASIAATKRLLREIVSLTIEQAAGLGAEANARSRQTDDFKKGIRAFLEKKKPSW